MQEEFKIITDFENYEVSNLGNVRNIETKRILKHRVNDGGYCRAALVSLGKTSHKLMHRLVAQEFLENPDDKMFIDHIDGNRQNNYVSNLRYATKIENNRNAVIRKDNTSGNKGVYFRSKNNVWSASISIDGKLKHLGLFKNKEDAIQCRLIKANEIYGLFVNACEKV